MSARPLSFVAVVLLHIALLLALTSARHVDRPWFDGRPMQVRLIQQAEASRDVAPLPAVHIEPTRIEGITVPVASLEIPPSQNAISAPQSAPKPVSKLMTAITPPQFAADYLTNPPPPYPAVSRRLREAGVALVRVLVTADGRAADVHLEQTSGFPRLDAAAVEAVRAWRFVPARRGEERVEAWALVPIEFALRTR